MNLPRIFPTYLVLWLIINPFLMISSTNFFMRHAMSSQCDFLAFLKSIFHPRHAFSSLSQLVVFLLFIIYRKILSSFVRLWIVSFEEYLLLRFLPRHLSFILYLRLFPVWKTGGRRAIHGYRCSILMVEFVLLCSIDRLDPLFVIYKWCFCLDSIWRYSCIFAW